MANFFSLSRKPTLQVHKLAKELQAWGDINTGSDNLPGLLGFCTTLQLAFAALEGKTTLIPLAPRNKIDEHGKLIAQPMSNALHIQKRPDAPIQILFGGHMDTVYPPGSPFQKCEFTSPSILQGPGVADMKGGLLILLKGLELFEASSHNKNIGWEILITPDEEIGSASSYPLWMAAAKQKKLCFIFEPSFPDGALVSARKGSMNIAVVALGKAAHVGRDFHSGRSAAVALSHFITKAHALNGSHPALTVNIGDVKSSQAPNVVAALATCQVNIRSDDVNELEATFAELETIAHSVALKSETSFSLHKLSHRPPKPFDSATETLFHDLQECAKTLGIDIQWRPSGGVTDGNFIAAQGIPTIDTLGVVGGDVHTHTEYVVIESIPERAHLLSFFLMHLDANHTSQGIS